MRRHKIAAIGGDGIGPEVTAAGCRVLEAAAGADGGFGFEVKEFDWASERYRRTGRMMPEDGLRQLEARVRLRHPGAAGRD
jgi:tartrate dehydrogenase/decarboxylase/D-malate dehydrogenase